ncbi:MAG TPA: DUF5719 family protein [Candidatus Anoxymicrobiaceae bacterium]
MMQHRLNTPSEPRPASKLRGMPQTLVALLAAAFLLASFFALMTPARAASGPQPPVGIEVFQRQQDQGLRLTLSWNGREDCAAYKVYRSSRLDGPYQNVGGVSEATMKDFPFFLDDTASPGCSYYYKVSAVDGNWAEGPMSSAVTAKMGVGRRGSGPGKSIIVSLADQRAYFLENDVIVNILRCSTGASGTPTGSYHIMAHRGTVSGCNFWMDWRPNYGMHAWPSYLGAYEENLGVAPRSHGCIRLHPLEAYWPYNWAPDGTPLTVIPNHYGGLPLAGVSCSNGVTAPSKKWYFAEGYFDANFLEYLLLFNPGNSPVTARTTYYPEGHSLVTESYVLPAGARQTITVGNVSGLPAQYGHAVFVDADGPIVAEQSEYFDMGGRRGGTSTVGATAPEKTWYFAEGYTGARFSLYLLLFNPGDKQADCHVTYYPEGAEPYHHDFTMPARSRGTTLVNALPGLNGKEVSIKVESSQPLVAQRNTYFDWTGFSYGVNGGDSSMGVTAPGKTWYLAEGCTGNYFDEYILVLNTSPNVATVNAEFETSTGPRPYSCQVAPNSRGTITVDSIPGMESADTGAVVTSDQDIVVERAMYSTRDSRRGGDSSTGISTLSKDWYFAEGYTGGTFDEYVLVMNPGADPTTVNCLFHLENGSEVGASYALGPKSRITIHADDIPGLQWVGSAVEVHSDRPVVAEQSEYFCVPR